MKKISHLLLFVLTIATLLLLPLSSFEFESLPLSSFELASSPLSSLEFTALLLSSFQLLSQEKRLLDFLQAHSQHSRLLFLYWYCQATATGNPFSNCSFLLYW